MSVNRSLITPTHNPLLEQALRDKLEQRRETGGSTGRLEALALRLGLIQNSLKPRFMAPQIALFAADHGLAVDGICERAARSTARQAEGVLESRVPVLAFARIQGLELSLVDAGVAEALAPHPRLLSRKIAHGTRNARVSSAMTLEQAHAAIRAGMEIADTLPGNVIACAGFGIGSHESAALLLSRLSETPLADLLLSGPADRPEAFARMLLVLQGAQARHRELSDPVEVLAALGGFEIAMMVGVMLVAGSKRSLVIVDGMAACAALMVAWRIAPAVTDYCVYARSHSHEGLGEALALFDAAPLLELGLECGDGTGATLAWPLLRSAAALLTDVVDADAGDADVHSPDASLAAGDAI
ncbi:MAG: nicotinate-nucleotide--dimethylbenzimidazole phosphoribosyltransferase [Burkholderiaceae bacterium]